MLVACLALASLLPGLGRTYLWDPDEPRFAAATREMMATGDYLAPVFNGTPRWEKPILFYWLQLAAYRTLGVNEWSARLPSALAGAACVVFVYLLGRTLFNRRAAAVAAILFLTTFRFVTYARQGLTDIPVLAFVLLAMFGFVRGAGAGTADATDDAVSRRAVWWAWIAIGLGVLTKGPIGLLPCVAVMTWLMVRREWPLLRTLRFGPGLVIAAAMAGPWYAYAIAVDRANFIAVHIGRELVARATSPTFGRQDGPLYYLRIAPGELAPWTLLIACALVWAFWRWRSGADRRAWSLLACWSASIFTLFSLARYKLPHYVLPAYPPLLLLTGAFVDDAVRRASAWRTVLRAGLAVTAVILAAGVGLLVWIKPLLLPEAPANGNGVLILLTVALLAAAGCAIANRVRASIALMGGLVALLYPLIAMMWSADIRNHFQAGQALGRTVLERLPPETQLAVIGPRTSLAYYAERHVSFLQNIDAAAGWVAGTPGPHAIIGTLRDARRLQAMIPCHCAILGQRPLFAPRLKHILDGRATVAPDDLVLLQVE
ncbi:MAG TPA: glycosyltransferase family 39 protein [Vicinamibacterales bacterium]|nr:glycosyltransferase family 39 protein [Vicinamibacterales bacterium]